MKNAVQQKFEFYRNATTSSDEAAASLVVADSLQEVLIALKQLGKGEPTNGKEENCKEKTSKKSEKVIRGEA